MILLTREDAEEIRDEFSESYRRAEESGAANSFWHTRFLRMWEKSAIRRLVRVVPKSAELRALIDADDAGERGETQILHAPDPEAARLLADAVASQDVPAPKVARSLALKRNKVRRRAGRRAGRRG